MFDLLRRSITFEDYAALCKSDKQPPPTREEYEAALRGCIDQGHVGQWLGFTLIRGK